MLPSPRIVINDALSDAITINGAPDDVVYDSNASPFTGNCHRSYAANTRNNGRRSSPRTRGGGVGVDDVDDVDGVDEEDGFSAVRNRDNAQRISGGDNDDGSLTANNNGDARPDRDDWDNDR